MIPKKIHYCWLSGDEFPPLIQHCIETWHRVLPDYELVLWDKNRFDITSVPWVEDAYKAGKYAFAADYIRLYAVYTEGGIYLDSDVEVLKTFDDLLNNESFIGFEAATENVEAAIFGAEAGCEWISKALSFYKDKRFILNEDRGVNSEWIAPIVFGNAFRQTFTDFPSKMPAEPLHLQGNGGLLLCPPDYFSPIKYDLEKCYSTENNAAKRYRSNPRTYCIHRFNGAWTTGTPPMKLRLWEAFKKKSQAMFGKRFTDGLLRVIRWVVK